MSQHRPRAVALIDGEHYPDVVAQSLRSLGDRYQFVAAVFLGGTEKIRGTDLGAVAQELYGLPVVIGAEPLAAMDQALTQYEPDCVVDVSDEPVVGYVERFRYASFALARGIAYLGSDFHFSPPLFEHLASAPSLSIIGTAKRVGKTALSGYVARVLQRELFGEEGSGRGVVIVPMGRGGPVEPEVIDGLQRQISSRELLDWSRQGRHAASDHFEDAVLSRVTTVGCRRCGGGLAGQVFVSNVAQGVRAANRLEPGLLILEGSGSAIPPVYADARICLAGAHQPLEYVVGYFGTYRLLVSDAVVVAMAEEPLASKEKVERLIEGIRELKPNMPVVPVVFRPRPLEDVRGRRAALFSTTPPSMEWVVRGHLEAEYGCSVRLFSSNLSRRPLLKQDLERQEMKEVDVVLTEIKAAAIDVVAEAADAKGLPVVFVDNDPLEVAPAKPGDLVALCVQAAATARARFAAGAGHHDGGWSQ